MIDLTGTRVRISEKFLAEHARTQRALAKWTGRTGTIVGLTKNHTALRVHWDGLSRNCVDTMHPTYVERIE